MMTCLTAQITFLPKYLVSIKHLAEMDMGKTMSAFGLGSIIWGSLVPGLSDKFGRKPLVIIFFFLSALIPLGIIYAGKSVGSLSLLLLSDASIMGCFPIIFATIPSESLPRQYIAQTIGLVIGVGELMGGFVAPLANGWSADQFGLDTPFLIASGAAICAGLIGFFFNETAPSVLIMGNNKVRQITT